MKRSKTIYQQPNSRDIWYVRNRPSMHAGTDQLLEEGSMSTWPCRRFSSTNCMAPGSCWTASCAIWKSARSRSDANWMASPFEAFDWMAARTTSSSSLSFSVANSKHFPARLTTSMTKSLFDFNLGPALAKLLGSATTAVEPSIMADRAHVSSFQATCLWTLERLSNLHMQNADIEQLKRQLQDPIPKSLPRKNWDSSGLLGYDPSKVTTQNKGQKDPKRHSWNQVKPGCDWMRMSVVCQEYVNKWSFGIRLAQVSLRKHVTDYCIDLDGFGTCWNLL